MINITTLKLKPVWQKQYEETNHRLEGDICKIYVCQRSVPRIYKEPHINKKNTI